LKDQTHEDGAADGRGAGRVSSVPVPDRMNELTDEMIHSVDATTGAGIDPKSGIPVWAVGVRESILRKRKW
jgi:hypothetical protein